MTSRAPAVIAFDTATAATVVGLSVGGTLVCELADRPGEDQRPRHAERLLTLCEEALAQAGLGWGGLARIGVGVGPGTFTGLRIGVATAQGLAQATALPVVAVSTLEALSLRARAEEPLLQIAAVGDARRGEAYVAAWSADGTPAVAAQACRPERLAAVLAADHNPTLAVGDGALIFRKELESGGIEVPEDGSPLHRLDGGSLCELAASGAPVSSEELVPHYVRRPDAEIALQARAESS